MSTTPTSSKQRRGVRVVSQTKVPLPPQLKRVNLDAAGIDIGAAEHWAAVPPGRNTEGQDVRRFGAFTGELCALGGLAEAMWDPDSGDGIHRSLLDSALRAVGGARL